MAPQAQGARSRRRGAHGRALTTRLFVYGTLAPGRDAWPVLEPWVVGDPQPDAVAGCLYDTGRGYPAATFGAPESDESLNESSTRITTGLVHGTVLALDPARAGAALAALDRYEGHEYQRISVRTRAGLEAAAYAWIAPLAGCRPVPNGRWDDRPQAETPPPPGR